MHPRSRCTPNPAADAPEPSGTVIGTVTADGAGARARTREADPDLIQTILHALGFDRGQTHPKYWIGADAPLIVSRWQTDLGLTPDEITHVARQNAIQFGGPAQGPKVLTRHMQAFANANAAPPLHPTSTGTRAAQPPPIASVAPPIRKIRARLPSEIPQ